MNTRKYKIVSHTKPGNGKSASLFALYLALAPSPAFAYVDPGFGSLVLQALAASIVGGLFYFRQVRDAIFSFFRRDKKPSINKPAGESNDDSSI